MNSEEETVKNLLDRIVQIQIKFLDTSYLHQVEYFFLRGDVIYVNSCA